MKYDVRLHGAAGQGNTPNKGPFSPDFIRKFLVYNRRYYSGKRITITEPAMLAIRDYYKLLRQTSVNR